MGEKVANEPSSELIAGPAWAPGIDDLARLRALTRQSDIVIHSDLRGASMGAAIPDGARIRIRSSSQAACGVGRVIVFMAGSRIMAHRIVHEGRRGAAQQFVLTQGDGNWLCDPPVNRATVVGEVEAFSIGGDAWQPVGAARLPPHRLVTARASLALMRLALECSPAFAIRLSRPMSWIRMGPRLLLAKLRRYRTGHVRH